MIGIFQSFLKNKKYTLLGYVLGTTALLEMYVALFPTFSQVASDKLDLLIQSYPKEIWTVIGVDPNALSFSHLESFLATEQYSFVWPILMIIFAIGLANATIVSEVEKGTIEFFLAQPFSRVKFFLSRYLASATLIAAFVFATIYAVIPLAGIHNVDIKVGNNMTLAVSALLFGLAIFSLASVSSAIFSEKSKASVLSTGIILLMYVMNVLSGLKESLSDLKYYSFFHYFNGSTNFVQNQYVHNFAWFFLGVIVISTTIAAIIFSKRDISV